MRNEYEYLILPFVLLNQIANYLISLDYSHSDCRQQKLKYFQLKSEFQDKEQLDSSLLNEMLISG